MTKSELIALLAADPAVIGNHLTARDVDDAVNSILNAMTAALAQGSRIEIRGFGSFSLNYRPPRVGRNPKFPPRSCLTSRPVKKCVNA